MSQIHERSPKHCAEKGITVKKRHRKLFLSISLFVTLLLLFILLIWLLLHPTKPEFSLTEAELYEFNVSGQHLLNSSIQATLLSKNPNRKVGIYYDELQVYAAFKGQQITADVSLSPFYQAQEDVNLLTASLEGRDLAVSPYIAYEVDQDQKTGRVILNLEANGKLRWKIGTWVSGQYRFNTNCVAFTVLRPSSPAGPITSMRGTQCSTTL